MSDTMQVVQWTLEYTCPLRSADASKDPLRTLQEVSKARQVADSWSQPRSGCGIMGDIYVNAYTMEPVPKSLWGKKASQVPSDNEGGGDVLDFLHKRYAEEGSTVIHFPSSGFIISQAFAAVGGIEGLLSLCGNCPANADLPHPAGCAGRLYLRPHDAVLQEQLAEIVDRLRLRARLDTLFVSATPIWFGLWTRSPLGDAACELLDLLLGELVAVRARAGTSDQSERDYLDELRSLQRATRISRERKIPLHASMAPPGHCDLGWSTIFAHCPRCKAEADLPRWKRRYPRTPYECRVCGFRYVPSATASSERVDFDMEDQDLRNVLGEARYHAFALQYLTSRGLPPEGARRLLDRLDAEHAESQAKMEVQKHGEVKRRRFIETVLFAGLHPTALPGSENEGEEFFRAEELRELLRRCESSGANVIFMFHVSENDDLCLSQRVSTSRAEATLEDWQSKGCSEWFSVCIGIPDSVLDKADI